MGEELYQQLILDESSEENIEETMKTFGIPIDPRNWESQNIDDWFYWMRHKLRFKFQKDIPKDCIDVSANFKEAKDPKLWIAVYGEKPGLALFQEFQLWLKFYHKNKNNSMESDNSTKSPPGSKSDSMEIDNDMAIYIESYPSPEKASTIPHYTSPYEVKNDEEEDLERRRKFQNSCQAIPRLISLSPYNNSNTNDSQITKIISNNNNNNNVSITSAITSNNSNNYFYNKTNNMGYHSNFNPAYNRNRTNFSSISNHPLGMMDNRKFNSNQIRSTLQNRILQQTMQNNPNNNRGVNRFKNFNSSSNPTYISNNRNRYHHPVSTSKPNSYSSFLHKTIKDSHFSDKPKRRNEKKEGLYLWQTLLRLLSDPSYISLICWIDKSRGTFKINKPPQVAQIWGATKNNPSMSYDKMSRSMRQYYKTGLLKKESHDKLNYCFNMSDEHVVQFLSKCNEKLPSIRTPYHYNYRASSTPPSNASSSATIPAEASFISKLVGNPVNPSVHDLGNESVINNHHQNHIDDVGRITSPNSSITTTTNQLESASSIVSFLSNNSNKSSSSSPFQHTTTTSNNPSTPLSALHSTTSIYSPS